MIIDWHSFARRLLQERRHIVKSNFEVKSLIAKSMAVTTQLRADVSDHFCSERPAKWRSTCS